MAPHPPNVVELEGDFNHRMLHTRGTRLHVAEAGNRGDPLILLIHGAFGGWFDFKDAIAPLAAHGLHVAALDARGFGMSDKPPHRAGDTLQILSGDVEGVIRTLGHTRAAVVGADTGSVIAKAAAKRHNELIHQVISLPTSSGFPAALTRLPAPLLSLSERALDSIWRANFAAETSDAFHASQDFQEHLALRLAARRIDNALSHIVAASRLRPFTAQDSDLDGPIAQLALPHVEDPTAFVMAVVKLLDL